MELKNHERDYSCWSTGLYLYDSHIFNIIKTLKPSSRGELEITDVNNAYIQTGMMTYEIVQGYWSDAGTFESLAAATELVRQEREGKQKNRKT